jgi:DNA-binding CsgD family transcriptional regulator
MKENIMKSFNFFLRFIARIIVLTRSYKIIVNYVHNNFRKVIVPNIHRAYNFFRLPIINRVIDLKYINLKAHISLTFNDIIRSFLISYYLTKNQAMILKLIISDPIGTKNTIRIYKDFEIIISQLLYIFESPTYLNLLFTVVSTTHYYVKSKLLSSKENLIMGMLVLGYSRMDICDCLHITKSSMHQFCKSIFNKLEVESLEEALIVILKENGTYKDYSKIHNDIGRVTIWLT